MKMFELVEKVLAQRSDDDSPLRIVQAGHPALRAQSRPYTGQLSDELFLELVNAMITTMYDAPGVGVAAPQVGLPLQLVVMADHVEDPDADDNLYERRDLPLMAVANPRYEAVEGDNATVFGWEGCLSVDGWRSLVPRPKKVRVFGTAFLADGTRRELDEVWSGWPARIFQHEADHLSGILCHDRAVPRSVVSEEYQGRYTELSDAVHYLGLSGDVARIAPGEVEIRR